MVSKYKKLNYKFLYIFFAFLSLNIFFFSTEKVEGKAFNIDNIEISEPFKINFNKNKVIDDGFEKAFIKLIRLTLNSQDQKKIKDIKLNVIKGMIESFSIKEEKFIDEVYYVNLGVSFNKKKVFKYLENRNIFPSVPLKKKILFIPIIIDEKKKDLLIFNNNKFFDEWNLENENTNLLEYILPSEDLEDLNLIKSKFDSIEEYDFKEIRNKYYLDDSIISLFFKNNNEIRILSRISIKENVILKNQSFKNIDISDTSKIKNIINFLKIDYEDYWKTSNQINTSIRLVINIKIKNFDNNEILKFENMLNKIEFVNNFFIYKFDKEYIYYQIIFNGTQKNFLKTMKENKYYLNTQNKIWILK